MPDIINCKLKFCSQKSGFENMFGAEDGRIRFSIYFFVFVFVLLNILFVGVEQEAHWPLSLEC